MVDAVNGSVAKSVLESKTFWGVVLAVVYPYLVKHGYTGTPDAVTTDVVQWVGAGLAMYGRWTAAQPLTLVK